MAINKHFSLTAAKDPCLMTLSALISGTLTKQSYQLAGIVGMMVEVWLAWILYVHVWNLFTLALINMWFVGFTKHMGGGIFPPNSAELEKHIHDIVSQGHCCLLRQGFFWQAFVLKRRNSLHLGWIFVVFSGLLWYGFCFFVFVFCH